MRKEKREKLLVRLADMIDAHSGNWNELCELQELVKELRSHPIRSEQSIRQDATEKVLDKLGMYLDVELERASQFNAMRNFALLEVKRKIKELRQEGKEQP